MLMRSSARPAPCSLGVGITMNSYAYASVSRMRGSPCSSLTANLDLRMPRTLLALPEKYKLLLQLAVRFNQQASMAFSDSAILHLCETWLQQTEKPAAFAMQAPPKAM